MQSLRLSRWNDACNRLLAALLTISVKYLQLSGTATQVTTDPGASAPDGAWRTCDTRIQIESNARNHLGVTSFVYLACVGTLAH